MQNFAKLLFFTLCVLSSLFVKANEDYDVYLKYHPLALFNLNRPAIQGSTYTCPCGMKNGRTHLSLGLQNIESSANGLAWLLPARWNGLRSSGRC